MLQGAESSRCCGRGNIKFVFPQQVPHQKAFVESFQNAGTRQISTQINSKVAIGDELVYPRLVCQPRGSDLPTLRCS